MLPTDAKTRKGIPVYEGFFKYFPDAIAAVAQCSAISNKQHSGEGAPIKWVKETSTDEMDALLRHALDGTSEARDAEGVMHMVKVGWRAFANLQRMADAGIDIFACLSSPTEDLDTGMGPSGGDNMLLIKGGVAPLPIELQDRRKFGSDREHVDDWLEPDPEA